MGGRDSHNEGIWQRIRVEIARDPKRAWLLAALLVVLAGICGWEVLSRLGPARAGAAEASAPAAPGALAPAPALVPAAGVDDANDAPGGPEIPAGRKATVDRDLFTPNPMYFPPNQEARIAPKVVDAGPNPEQREEARRRAVRAQAQSLTLQSTVIGSVPTAIINGRVLRVGERINGFQVVRIGTYDCLLEREGVRVMLELSK